MESTLENEWVMFLAKAWVVAKMFEASMMSEQSAKKLMSDLFKEYEGRLK